MSADGRSIRCLAIPPVAFYTNSSSAWSETVFELFKMNFDEFINGNYNNEINYYNTSLSFQLFW